MSNDVFSLMGGTASAYVCYIIPAATAWRLRERIPMLHRSWLAQAMCAALFFFGLLVGVLSTATTVAGFFGESNATAAACNSTYAGRAAPPHNDSYLIS